jgi:hypothetical protein
MGSIFFGGTSAQLPQCGGAQCSSIILNYYAIFQFSNALFAWSNAFEISVTLNYNWPKNGIILHGGAICLFDIVVPYDRFRPLAAARRITEEAAAAAALDQPCRNWRSTKLRFRFLQLDLKENLSIAFFLFFFFSGKKK